MRFMFIIKNLAVSLEILEVNIGTVRKEANLLSKSSDAEEHDAMAATFYLLEDRFQLLEKDVNETVQQLKVFYTNSNTLYFVERQKILYEERRFVFLVFDIQQNGS